MMAVLLIGAAVLASTRPTSVGLPLRVAEVVPCYPGVYRVVVIQASANGSVKVDAESIRRAELGEKLDNIFRTRAMRFAYVTAESDVPFGEVVEVIDVATKHLDHVALLPRSQVLDRQPQPGEIDVCMDMSVGQREAKTSDRHLSLWH
jgi:biopolymer transport protein ExbD